jgi:hypothetical protein
LWRPREFETDFAWPNHLYKNQDAYIRPILQIRLRRLEVGAPKWNVSYSRRRKSESLPQPMLSLQASSFSNYLRNLLLGVTRY